MKKIAFVLGLLFTATMSFSADLIPLNYQFPVVGTPVDNTFKATLDNTTVSIKTLVATAGIDWLQSGQPPQGVLVSVETKDARTGNAAIVSGSVGHVLAAGSSWRFGGAGFLDALCFTSSVATDNTGVVQITLER
jgi:hypothetical protein